MANSILPDTGSAGGIVYRSAEGVPLNPPDVENAYPPLPAFTSSCLLTALPSNCDARIEPRQINAIVSELISFAECLDPNGTWDCNSLKNLCTAFSAYVTVVATGLIISDTPPVAGDGILWWESDTGNLFIHYRDADNVQWVQVAGSPVMDGVTIVGHGNIADPYAVGVVDCGEW